MRLTMRMRDAIEIFRSLSAAKASDKPAPVTYGLLIGRNWRAFRDVVSDAEEARNKLLDKCAAKDGAGKKVTLQNGEIAISDMDGWLHGNREIENLKIEVEIAPIRASLFPADLEPIISAGLFDLVENEAFDSSEGERDYYDEA